MFGQDYIPFDPNDCVSSGIIFTKEERQIKHSPIEEYFLKSMVRKNLKPLPIPKLSIELVPSTCWYSNIRSNVSTQVWDILRRDTYKRAKYTCEICGGKGNQWPVECHEIFEYIEDPELETNIQRLVNLIALCPACHKVKHIGLASIQGLLEDALQHLSQVNNWPAKRAYRYSQQAFRIWEERSLCQWKLDISWLHNHLAHLMPPNKT